MTKGPLFLKFVECVSKPTLDAHAHGFWVGMGSILLCIPASGSKSESNFSDAGNTLTKKRSGLNPTIVNDLLFV